MPGSSIYRVHDLLQIDTALLLSAAEKSATDIPAWVPATLLKAPCVVVRRGFFPGTTIPVGVRGPTRNLRWAAFCPIKAVISSASPRQLLSIPIPNQRAAIPALHALAQLKSLWANLPYQWGPAGSVAFELFQQTPTATETSDLDIILNAPDPITIAIARQLCMDIANLSARVDVRIETPIGGFLLTDYATGNPTLLRTQTGEVLRTNPWQTHMLERSLAVTQ